MAAPSPSADCARARCWWSSPATTTGVHGDAPLDIMTAEAQRSGALQLFVDTRDVDRRRDPRAPRPGPPGSCATRRSSSGVTVLVSDKLINSAVGVASTSRAPAI
jgi:hypothetical protein